MPDSKVSQLPAATSLEENDLLYIVQNAIDKSIQASLLPVVKPGFVIDYAGIESSVPAGWLPCDGRELNRVTYAALFAALSTVYGAGDGTTTFNLPDFRGRVGAGKDDMGGVAANRLGTVLSGGTLGAVGGSEQHLLTAAEMPSHSHTASSGTAGNHNHSASSSTTGNHNHSASSSTAGAHTHTTYCTRIHSGSSPHNSPGGAGIPLNLANWGSSSAGNHAHSITVNNAGNHAHSITVNNAGSHAHSITVDSAGSGGSHSNMPPAIIINKIIYTGVLV